ncbi:MAG: hypothetical protein ACREV4_13215 [Gammaproteobacteria bacterium]
MTNVFITALLFGSTSRHLEPLPRLGLRLTDVAYSPERGVLASSGGAAREGNKRMQRLQPPYQPFQIGPRAALHT